MRHEVIDEARGVRTAQKAARTVRLVVELVLFGVMILLLLVCFWLFVYPDSEQVGAANAAAGADLTTALHAHQRASGTYPRDLESLVPQHIPAVPKARRGTWRYQPTGNRTRFELRLEGASGNDPSGYYAFDAGEWVIDTK